MPAFLTTESVMLCPHGGSVQAISGNTQVTAGGAPILRGSDTFIVAGCAFNIAGAPSPCVTIQWVQTATRNTIGDAVLNMASIGLCLAATQAPQGPVIVASAQPAAQGL